MQKIASTSLSICYDLFLLSVQNKNFWHYTRTACLIPNFFTSIQCSIIMYISPQFYDITRCLWHVNHVSQEHELECKKRCFLCSFVFKIRWKVCHRVRTPQKIDKHTEIVNHYIFCVVWKILSIEFHICRKLYIT